MTEKPKKEPATTTSPIASAAFSSISIKNVQLESDLQITKDALKDVTKDRDDLKSFVDGEVRGYIIGRIVNDSNGRYKQTDLEPKNTEELMRIQEEIKTLLGTDTTTATFKPIRAGNDTERGRTTVGDLYGKTRKEILAMGGDF